MTTGREHLELWINKGKSGDSFSTYKKRTLLASRATTAKRAGATDVLVCGLEDVDSFRIKT